MQPPPNTTRDNTARDNTTRDNTTRDNTTRDNTTCNNTTLLQVELEEEEDFDDTETWGFRTPVKHGSGEIHLEEEVQKEVLEGALQGALQGVQTGAQDGVQCNGGSDPVVSHRPHNGLFYKVELCFVECFVILRNFKLRYSAIFTYNLSASIKYSGSFCKYRNHMKLGILLRT